jgi:hypothetical protein
VTSCAERRPGFDSAIPPMTATAHRRTSLTDRRRVETTGLHCVPIRPGTRSGRHCSGRHCSGRHCSGRHLAHRRPARHDCDSGSGCDFGCGSRRLPTPRRPMRRPLHRSHLPLRTDQGLRALRPSDGSAYLEVCPPFGYGTSRGRPTWSHWGPAQPSSARCRVATAVATASVPGPPEVGRSASCAGDTPVSAPRVAATDDRRPWRS